jgi:hypothetical protein
MASSATYRNSEPLPSGKVSPLQPVNSEHSRQPLAKAAPHKGLVYFINPKNFCVLTSAAGHVFLHKDDFGRMVEEMWVPDPELWPPRLYKAIAFDAVSTPERRNKWRAQKAYYLKGAE